jgi:SAM-dependent methyltransferase
MDGRNTGRSFVLCEVIVSDRFLPFPGTEIASGPEVLSRRSATSLAVAESSLASAARRTASSTVVANRRYLEMAEEREKDRRTRARSLRKCGNRKPYRRPNCSAIRAAGGPNTSITSETLAPFDHFHGGGLATTQELAAALQPQTGETILDSGCGIGGPARWIARRYNCSLTGVDLTQEFCDAARELNSLCGMAERVRIVEGSALSRPLPDAVFDRAFSQFMVMNVADKAGVYREAFRVLKPGGRFRGVSRQFRAEQAAGISFALGRHVGSQLSSVG